MVDGFALGGGTELALSCDIRLASERSTFGQPEINLGLIPGGGGTQRLCRLVGYGRAMEIVLSGGMVDAEDALSMGIVNRILPSDNSRRRDHEASYGDFQEVPTCHEGSKTSSKGCIGTTILRRGLDGAL